MATPARSRILLVCFIAIAIACDDEEYVERYVYYLNLKCSVSVYVCMWV